MRNWTASFFVGLLLLAPSAAAVGEKGDAAALQGRWQATSLQRDGMKATPEELMGFTFTVKDNAITFGPGTKDERRGTFEHDAKGAPKTIDITVVTGKKKSKLPGIYELKGDQLTLCLREVLLDKGRPAEFKTRRGDGAFLAVLTRVRD